MHNASLFDHTNFAPIGEDVSDIFLGLFRRYLIFLTKAIGQRLYGKFAHLLSLFPKPCCRLVQGQQFAKIDGSQSFAYYYVLTAHLAQNKSFLNIHNSL